MRQPTEIHSVLQESQRLFYTLQATHSTTGEPETILHPTGHTQYYRKARDYFTPYRPLTVLQESQRQFYTLQATHSTTGEPEAILHPTGHSQYYRRARDYFTPYRPHSTTGQPETILHPTGHTQYYRTARDYLTPYRPHSRSRRQQVSRVPECTEWPGYPINGLFLPWWLGHIPGHHPPAHWPPLAACYSSHQIQDIFACIPGSQGISPRLHPTAHQTLHTCQTSTLRYLWMSGTPPPTPGVCSCQPWYAIFL